jgi:hypothetical protein
MLHRLFRHMRQNVVAWLALFVALGGTSAWATHETILSSDIVNNEVFTSDVRDDTLSFGGLFHQDLAANSVRSSEIATGAVGASEIADGQVFGIDVANGALTDRDISQADGAIRNFNANIGSVGAHSCVYRAVTGVNATRDHLLLTPNFNTTSSFLIYGIEYEDTREQADIKVCNPTAGVINDGITRFNLLVINGVANT